MAVGPASERQGADLMRHGQPISAVVRHAAELDSLPLGPEETRAHLRVGLEAAAGQDHRSGVNIEVPFQGLRPNPCDAAPGIRE